MKNILIALWILMFALSATADSFSDLEKRAAEKTRAVSRVALAGENDLKTIKNADALESGRAANYVRALAQNTKAAPQFAHLVQTLLFGGTLRPETKMAMGLKISQMHDSAYAFAHARRWLKTSENGRNLFDALRENKPETLTPAEQTALRYAALLTVDVNGITDEEFRKVRSVYNDSQIVELTMTVSFFNYFTRFVEALNLPVEDWVLNDAPKRPENLTVITAAGAPSRVALITDDEMAATQKLVENAKAAQASSKGLGLGIANSQRAMLRVPALAQSWRDYGFQNRQSWQIDRNLQLQISFAVSNANGCRYCTVHQVVGLRRLGVEPKKLLAMKKDDSMLTPKELKAVKFARQLTRQPNSISDADFASIKNEFGEQGALEVVMQTCAFAFMNRFTDTLRLPSEDEAIKIYKETYGENSLR